MRHATRRRLGGFLGIGEKTVAIPSKALAITRNPDHEIDKVSVGYSKDELEEAPAFAFAGQDDGDEATSTTGSVER